MQYSRFLELLQLLRILEPLLKTVLPLMKNILQWLVKIVRITLGLKAIASTTDAWIHKKFLESRLFLGS